VSSLYDRIARTEGGSRQLAAARLRHEVLKLVHRAQRASGLNQVQLAKRLGVRKSAVNQVLRGDGNLRINTLAEYLHATGFEMTVELVPAGQPREQVLLRRALYASGPRIKYDIAGSAAAGSHLAVVLTGAITLHSAARSTWLGTARTAPADASADAHRAMYQPEMQPIAVGTAR
jgi:transcriptional regulator with XRE-family HTH domain